MSRITIEAGRILHDGRDYGPEGALLVYPGEERGLGGDTPGPVQTPHNIDLISSIGPRILGCEVKKLPDLVDSWFSRRLHRQLRTLLSTVDIPVLVIRGWDWEELHSLFQSRNAHMRRKRGWNEFMEDMVNLQSQGVYLFPVAEEGYGADIAALCRALASPGTRILAGTDPAPRDRKPGWLLRRVKNIGKAKSAALIKEHGTSLDVLIAARNGQISGATGEKLIKAGRE